MPFTTGTFWTEFAAPRVVGVSVPRSDSARRRCLRGTDMAFTQDQVEAYVDSNGLCCPYCGSDLIDPDGKPRYHDGMVTADMCCNACGELWRETFKLNGIEETGT